MNHEAIKKAIIEAKGLKKGLKMMAAMIQNGVSEVAKATEKVVNKAATELKNIFKA